MKRIKTLALAATFAALTAGNAFATENTAAEPAVIDTVIITPGTEQAVAPGSELAFKLEMKRLELQQQELEQKAAKDRRINNMQIQRDSYEITTTVLLIVFGSMLLLTLLILIYKMRRRHAMLNVVKLAIQNNYDLPAEFYGHSAPAQPQQPIIVTVDAAGQPVAPAAQPASPAAQASAPQPAIGVQPQPFATPVQGDLMDRFTQLYMQRRKSVNTALITMAVGLFIFIWGASIHEGFFAWVGLFIIVIGIARILLLMVEQRGMKQYIGRTHSAAHAQPAPAAPQAPQAPQQPQQPTPQPQQPAPQAQAPAQPQEPQEPQTPIEQPNA